MSKRDLVMGMAIGAAVAFLVDPQSGRRRRVRARDQFVRAGRKTRDAMGSTARHLANRGGGLFAATRGRWAHDNADDRRLSERVRAMLGRASAHPGAIEVAAADGIVTLRGPILASEMDDVLAAVWAVRGVLAVNNGLEAHQSSWDVPSLQIDGWGVDPSAEQPRSWMPSPALMTAAGLAATGLAMAAYRRRPGDQPVPLSATI
jgi:hypothetical protein